MRMQKIILLERTEKGLVEVVKAIREVSRCFGGIPVGLGEAKDVVDDIPCAFSLPIEEIRQPTVLPT